MSESLCSLSRCSGKSTTHRRRSMAELCAAEPKRPSHQNYVRDVHVRTYCIQIICDSVYIRTYIQDVLIYQDVCMYVCNRMCKSIHMHTHRMFQDVYHSMYLYMLCQGCTWTFYYLAFVLTSLPHTWNLCFAPLKNFLDTALVYTVCWKIFATNDIHKFCEWMSFANI